MKPIEDHVDHVVANTDYERLRGRVHSARGSARNDSKPLKVAFVLVAVALAIPMMMKGFENPQEIEMFWVSSLQCSVDEKVQANIVINAYMSSESLANRCHSELRGNSVAAEVGSENPIDGFEVVCRPDESGLVIWLSSSKKKLSQKNC
ncbi:MAG: hypothetical protein RL410_781 [Actinomycetota bacterium]|jgi:hypothetical protein